jgi:predicted aspartyl protease
LEQFLHQGQSGEEAFDFILKIHRASKLAGIPENIALQSTTRGLRSNIQMVLWTHKPQTFDQLFSFIQDMPQTQHIIQGSVPPDLNQDWVPMEIDTTLYSRDGNNGNSNKNIHSQKTFQGKCYFCGKSGHRQADCWSKNGHRTPFTGPRVANQRVFGKAKPAYTKQWSSKYTRGHQNNTSNSSYLTSGSTVKDASASTSKSAASNIASSVSLGNAGMLTVMTMIKKCSVRAIVDTGSSTSLVSNKAAIKLCLDYDTNITIPIKTVSGQMTNTIGRICEVPVWIGKKPFTRALNVINTDAYDLLLGIDFLKKHKASLDISNDLLSLGHHQVPTQCMSTSTVAAVLVSEVVKIETLYIVKKISTSNRFMKPGFQ